MRCALPLTLPAALPALAMLLAGCATTEPAPRPIAVAEVASPPAAAGLDRVLGRPAPALALLFGAPALDIREGKARKLQYRGAACVLDIYLYPPAASPSTVNGDAATVTWIDARDRKGANLDRASCIAALVRSEPAKHPPASRHGRQ